MRKEYFSPSLYGPSWDSPYVCNLSYNTQFQMNAINGSGNTPQSRKEAIDTWLSTAIPDYIFRCNERDIACMNSFQYGKNPK